MPAHPALSNVWRASELAPATSATVASGHALLDAELPAGGWPLAALIELLVADARAPWSSLLLPALVSHASRQGGVLALLDPPFVPHVPALVAAGLPVSRLLWLRGASAADASWLAGQAAGCADVAAVLAWLPRARTAHLRRLHVMARRRSRLLLFVFLDAAGPAAAAPSCAPLRLALQCARESLHGNGAMPRLRVDILRRRGPPLEQPLWLPAHNAALQALLDSKADASAGSPGCAGANVLAFPQERGGNHAGGHALDRFAMAG